MEKVPEVLPEPLSDKGVDHRVDAAVRVGDHLRHQHGHIQLFALLTVGLKEDRLISGEKENQVVRSPENEKDHHDDKNEPDGLILFPTGASDEGFNDSGIADSHNEQRQNETQDIHPHSVKTLPGVLFILWVK